MGKDGEADMASLKADVASFAATIGLAPSQNGFNDVDFRKKPVKKEKSNEKIRAAGSSKSRQGNVDSVKNARNSRQNAPEKKKRLENPKRLDAETNEAVKTVKTVPPEKINRFAKDVVHTFARWGGTGEKWYETAAGIASKVRFLDSEIAAGNHIIDSKRSEAESILRLVSVEFEKSRKNNSDMRMILSARRSGTSADKVAAMMVLIQENPLANLHTLDSLLGMVTSKGGKRHALNGIDVLKELFTTSLLPDRKLNYLNSQPLATLPDTKEGVSLLVWWYWEDCIKERYEKFVNAVIEGSKDKLPYLKLKSIKTLYELLKAKPEQEKQLLESIVNKLGDPERKAASNAAYFLSSLLTEHPNMKKIVLREVELFVFRPNLGMRAIYYASVFMNQVMLGHKGDGPSVAKQLIDIYFGLFKFITHSKKVENTSKHEDEKDKSSSSAALDSRLLSSLLTGVNKAFRFVTEDSADAIIEEHTPALFRLVHSSNFNVGVQALLLLHQILAKHQAVSDRFYRSLYSVMLSPALSRSSKIEMFLSLIFKVLKSDVNSSRTCAFIKRLMQVAMHQSPELGCAFLVLLSEVLKARPLLWNFILEPVNEDNDNEHFKDIDIPVEQDHQENPEEDSRDNRKEDSQEYPEEDSDSDIYVDEEMAKGLGDDDDNSDEDGDHTKKKERRTERQNVKNSEQGKPSSNKAESNGSENSAMSGYNPRHRDPLFCKADQTCWWELAVLASHIHPSVSTMAKTLLSNASIVYSGNPLNDLALAAFLDRFAEKKPKPRKTALDDTLNKEEAAAPVGMELVSMAEDEVAPADLVFHRFYCAKAAAKGTKRKKKRNKNEDDVADDFIGSDEEEDEVGGEVEDAAVGDIDDAEELKHIDEDINEDIQADDDDEEDIQADDDDEDDVQADSDDEDDVQADSDDEEDIQADDDNEEDIQADDDKEDGSEEEEIDKFLDEEMGKEFSDMDEDDSDIDSGDEEGFEFADNTPPKDEERKVSSKKKKKSGVNGVINSNKSSNKRRKRGKDKENEDVPASKKRSKKNKGTQASPFASAEDYAHLFDK